MFTEQDQNAIDTLKFLSVDAVEKANSGHPGLPMGAAAMSWVLWKNHLRMNPSDPTWIGRDRFILSAGHGSALLYSFLHLFGYKMTLEDLKNFRQWGSKTAGHPEFEPEIGIETTTGPLGQGFAVGVGMAIAAQHMKAKFNSGDQIPFDNFIYSICGDGDLQEGVSAEAASLAGHLKLGNMIYLYDDNGITIDGPTSLSFSENVGERFAAYDWHIQKVDGYDLEAIDNAISVAKKVTDKPSLILSKTHIGYGSPNKQDTSGVHGSPLGSDESALTKKLAGWEDKPEFYVSEETYSYLVSIISDKVKIYEKWQSEFKIYKKDASGLYANLSQFLQKELPIDLGKYLPKFNDDDKLATRAASGKVINAISEKVPFLIGGSADLAPSNNTMVKNDTDFNSENYRGRNFHFGVREHAMGSIANGMAHFDGIIPYVATFLVFSDYMRPAIRLAAMMKQQVIYIFTHDSIGLGEDGPTHQPVEHLAALRAIPGLTVIRPADARETVKAWEFALNHQGPTCLILTRQGLPIVSSEDKVNNLEKGAYVVWQADEQFDAMIAASGSEVSLAVKAASMAYDRYKISCRVVSMPSWEIFDNQDGAYKQSVFPERITKRIAVETAIGQGWEKYGMDSELSIFMNSFGASGPAATLFEKFGFTEENIVGNLEKLMK